MSGDARNYSHRGIIPRAMQHVFREVDMRSDRIYNIAVSYLEIYNESLRDLLAEDPAASDSLAILDDATNTVVSLLKQGKGNACLGRSMCWGHRDSHPGAGKKQQ
jgi:hypothetical protein